MNLHEKRDKIAEGAQKIIRREGQLQLSLHQLAKEVGIPYTTICRTFESKSNLIAHCLINEMLTMPKCLDDLQKRKLNNKEKMVVVMTFPFFSCCQGNGRGHLEMMLSGLSINLIQGASSEYKRQLSETQSLLYQKRWEFFSHCACAGTLNGSERTLKPLYRLLHLISRGGAYMAYQRHFIEEDYNLDEMITMAELALNGLHWKEGETLRSHKVKAVMRSLSDTWQ